ncbi:MAG: adenosylhomocysteinase [Deltaproteobacteria bacterium]|nr:adenosylhomocysteinase [Deltaproteobacteria bacterium]MCB9490092.1 adenosylhomocysteinase [Deltaproteobacteria bacterium]
MADYDVKDINLAAEGQDKTEWAEATMPVLRQIKERFEAEKPLKGLKVGACLHVTTETANLMITLAAGGADVSLCASNPLSTQDPTAAHLAKNCGIRTFAIKGEDNETYYKHVNEVIDAGVHATMDDGADLVNTLHTSRKAELAGVKYGTEETTTGVIRLRAMGEQGVLGYPVFAINDANTKHMFDNRYGTGQSTIDGMIRATNRLVAGSTFVVSGYGWCGRGLANTARGLGARVIVCEVDPLRGLEAVMDGYRVMPIAKAAPEGDFFCTVTGDINVIDVAHFEKMKNGAIVANSGHFNVELNLEGLGKLATSRRRVREFIEEYSLPNGNNVYVLADGRLVNLSAAEGHPSAVMDMSFANQALTLEWLAKGGADGYNKTVHNVPREIDEQVALLKLNAMGIEIDELTAEQKKYLESWEMGT